MAKIVLNDVASGFNLSKIKDNFDKISTALNVGVLWRDNPVGEANSFVTDQDANGKRILNLPDPVANGEPATKGWITAQPGSGAASAAAAAASATAAANSAAQAAANAAIVSPITGNALKYSRVNAGETAFEYRTPAQVLSDIGAAAVGHNHAGVYEPVDATILRNAAIGVTVQAFDANTVKKNVANVFTATQTPDNGTAAVSTTSTYTFDGTDQIREITLTNAIAVTFGAPTGIVQYAMYKLMLKAGDTSARTFAWNAAYKFPSATSQLTSGSTTTGAYDIITFIGGASNTLIYDGVSKDVR